jgi:hypothetical protein
MKWENVGAQCLSEDVRAILEGGDLHGLDDSGGYQLLSEVVSHANMLVLETTNRILGQRLGSVIVEENGGRLQL